MNSNENDFKCHRIFTFQSLLLLSSSLQIPSASAVHWYTKRVLRRKYNLFISFVVLSVDKFKCFITSIFLLHKKGNEIQTEKKVVFDSNLISFHSVVNFDRWAFYFSTTAGIVCCIIRLNPCTSCLWWSVWATDGKMIYMKFHDSASLFEANKKHLHSLRKSQISSASNQFTFGFVGDFFTNSKFLVQWLWPTLAWMIGMNTWLPCDPHSSIGTFQWRNQCQKRQK